MPAKHTTICLNHALFMLFSGIKPVFYRVKTTTTTTAAKAAGTATYTGTTTTGYTVTASITLASFIFSLAVLRKGFVLKYRSSVLNNGSPVLKYKPLVLKYKSSVLSNGSPVLKYRRLVLKDEGSVLKRRSFVQANQYMSYNDKAPP